MKSNKNPNKQSWKHRHTIPIKSNGSYFKSSERRTSVTATCSNLRLHPPSGHGTYKESRITTNNNNNGYSNILQFRLWLSCPWAQQPINFHPVRYDPIADSTHIYFAKKQTHNPQTNSSIKKLWNNTNKHHCSCSSDCSFHDGQSYNQTRLIHVETNRPCIHNRDSHTVDTNASLINMSISANNSHQIMFIHTVV